jgi:hypothetical protein
LVGYRSGTGTGLSEKPVLSDGIFKEFAVLPTQLVLANSQRTISDSKMKIKEISKEI